MTYITIIQEPEELDSTFHNDLFAPFERLVQIEILGQRVEVPENNQLLRCFQYLSMKTISYGDFCWNGDCTNCQVWYREPGDDPSRERTALSCRLDVIEGMVITRLAGYVRIEGITKSRETGEHQT
jgi:hypothetical protein